MNYIKHQDQHKKLFVMQLDVWVDELLHNVMQCVDFDVKPVTVVPATSTLLISNLPATSNLLPSRQVKFYHVNLPRRAPAPPRATSLCRKMGGT